MYLSQILLLLTSLYYTLGDLYDFIAQKDDEVLAVLTLPTGEDTDLYIAMDELANSYQLVTQQLRAHNVSVLPLARQLFDRGVPNSLLEHFYLNDIRRHFNWHREDLKQFHTLYYIIEEKWSAFEKEYKNAILYW